jgi:serine/threonine-protein kinase RsbW
MIPDLGPPRQDAWQVHCLSSFDEMARVIDVVLALLADLGYSRKDLFATRLVLEEAICNAIKHGHRCDPTKVVEVRYLVEADYFLVEVEDQGPGFDPARIPNATATDNRERPSGRGLLLMHCYAAWIRYNRAGNCVTFCICPSERLPH